MDFGLIYKKLSDNIRVSNEKFKRGAQNGGTKKGYF